MEENRHLDKHRYSYCMICTDDIYAESTDAIHFIFDDLSEKEIWVGRPICEDCYKLLEPIIPEKLDLIGKSHGLKPKPKEWVYCKCCGLAYPKLSKEGFCRTCIKSEAYKTLCFSYEGEKLDKISISNKKPKTKGLEAWL